MAFSVIATYSSVKYDSSGQAYLTYTGGIVLNWAVASLSGYYLGKHIKNVYVVVPIIVLCVSIANYLGLMYGEVVFDAIHLDIAVRLVGQLFMNFLFALVASMISFSKYHFKN